jgi:hypothetical protein
VHKAWDAVAVPGTPGGGGTVTVLTNGVAQTSLSGSTGTWKHFKITVPASQTKLEIVMSGGTGDADMYVKRGAQPTSSSYDYRPYLNGNNETVTVNNPVAGDWYISIYAYSTYSGVSLKATYSAAAACTSVSGTLSGTGANYYTTSYTSSVSGSHTGKLTGPSGTDFDLYLQKYNASHGARRRGESSTSTENDRARHLGHVFGVLLASGSAVSPLHDQANLKVGPGSDPNPTLGLLVHLFARQRAVSRERLQHHPAKGGVYV